MVAQSRASRGIRGERSGLEAGDRGARQDALHERTFGCIASCTRAPNMAKSSVGRMYMRKQDAGVRVKKHRSGGQEFADV